MMIYGLPRDPLLAQIIQAVHQQKQQEQQKAQVMQSLGFGGNMMPMGAIPQGHGIASMDGKVWTRPGGTPPGIQQLMESLLGAQAKPYASFQGFTNDLPQKQLVTAENRNLEAAKRAHQSASSLEDIEQLYRLYPREMEYLLGGGR